MKYIKTKLNNKLLIKLAIILLIISAVVLGILIRLYDLDNLPLDFHPTRQLRSLIIARGMYYDQSNSVPEDLKEIAVNQWKGEAIIEPPITERLTSWLYLFFNSDHMAISRILTISIWSLGGLGLFLLTKDIFGIEGAAVGLVYYFILPYAIRASRAFQPEPLLITSIILAWWGMHHWSKNSTWIWTVLAGLLTGLSIFVKSPAIFFVLPPLFIIIITKSNFITLLKNPKIWVLVLLTVLPTLIYHIYGVYINGFLASQFSLRFFPSLWTDAYYYRRWKDLIASTLILELFLLGGIGTFLINNKVKRLMFLSVWVGYILYGFVFSYHIHTHNYYQLPLLPAVSIGLAALTAFVFKQIKNRQVVVKSVIIVAIAFWMFANLTDVYLSFRDQNYRGQQTFWESMGDKLKGSSVISMTEDYGYRLAYWGWTPSTHWASSYDFEYRELAGQEVDQEALFEQAIQNKDLFVVTVFSELNRQPYVKDA